MAAGSGYDISASMSGASSASTGAQSNKLGPVTIFQGIGGSTGGGLTTWLIVAAIVAGLWFFLRRKK